MSRGGAAGATWIVRGDESRRRRGRDVTASGWSVHWLVTQVKAVQTFDLEASRISNGIFLGDWAAVRFFGPMEFDAGNRKLTFDFTRIELFGGALGFDLGQGGAAEIGGAPRGTKESLAGAARSRSRRQRNGPCGNRRSRGVDATLHGGMSSAG